MGDSPGSVIRHVRFNSELFDVIEQFNFIKLPGHILLCNEYGTNEMVAIK